MTMEVGCPQCGAKYQFDASAIPAQGYDAQCTGCGGVFFVAPEKPADPQISVSCSHCGAVYQFPASAIPAEGYDAQCTQCQQVFFVSATPAGDPGPVTQPNEAVVTQPNPAVADTQPTAPVVTQPTMPVDVAPTQPTMPVDVAPTQPNLPVTTPTTTTQPTDPVAITQPTAAIEPVQPPIPATMPEEPTPLTDLKAPTQQEPVSLDTLKAPAAEPTPAEPTPAEPTPADEREQKTGGEPADDMLAMADELGEPDAAPDGVSLEDDFGTIIGRRRKRRVAVLVVLAVLVAYSLITYAFAPRVFDSTVGRVVRIKLTVDPKAIPHAEKGLARMLDDTDAAYQEALVELDKALAIDDQYPAALAYKGLALVFRGSDVQERGRAIRARGQAAIDEIKAIEALPAKRRPKNSTERLAELRARATKADKDSARLFEAGGKTLREGYALLRDALEAYENDPLVVEAAGIYYTVDSDSLPRAGKLLRHSLQLRYGPEKDLDLESPPNGWLPYLQARVRSADKKGQKATRAAFASAYTKEPRFQRARYELAVYEESHEAFADAERLAKEILAQVATHEKSKALLARRAAAVAEPEPTPPPSKGKKRKRKRR